VPDVLSGALEVLVVSELGGGVLLLDDEDGVLLDDDEDDEVCDWSASMPELDGLIEPGCDVWYARSSSRVSLPSRLVSMSWNFDVSDGAATCSSASDSVPSLSTSAFAQLLVESVAASLPLLVEDAELWLEVVPVVELLFDWSWSGVMVPELLVELGYDEEDSVGELVGADVDVDVDGLVVAELVDWSVGTVMPPDCACAAAASSMEEITTASAFLRIFPTLLGNGTCGTSCSQSCSEVDLSVFGDKRSMTAREWLRACHA
jgi:hypothetical protein